MDRVVCPSIESDMMPSEGQKMILSLDLRRQSIVLRFIDGPFVGVVDYSHLFGVGPYWYCSLFVFGNRVMQV